MVLSTSAYTLDIEAKLNTTITPSTLTLTNSIKVTKELLNGNSGLFRVYFMMDNATGDYELSLRRQGNGNGALAEATISDGKVTKITITNSGGGYPIVPVVTIAAPVSGSQAFAAAVLQGGEVVDIIITNPGSGYVTPPVVTITPFVGTTINAKFNGDNAFALKSGGYYRFDIGVRVGDDINFIQDANSATLREFRVDQIQLGT